MSFKDFYEDLESAVKIAGVSKKHNLTLNQISALAGLYRGDSDYIGLKQKSKLSYSQFSRDVIGPLRQRGYINRRRSGKPLLITDEGRNLIEKVMKKKDIKMPREKCLAEDLEFILLALMLPREAIVELLNTDGDFGIIFTAKVLKHGKDIEEVRSVIKEHVSKCGRCFELYEGFIDKEIAEADRFLARYEVDKEYLKLYS